MTLHDIAATRLDGSTGTLDAWRGQVLLVVNVASRCGYTPQYAGLEALYREHREAGLAVLGFPCDQFGAQEPGDAAEIAAFCSSTYDVSFPLFQKVEVNGEQAHPLWKALKAAKPGILGTEAIKWNFTKFLVSRDGAVVRRYAPTDTPASLAGAITAQLRVPDPSCVDRSSAS